MLKEIIDGFAVSILAVFTLVLIVILPIYWFGQEFETRYFPVVTDYVATPLLDRKDLDPGYAWLEIKFNKVRQCAPIDTFQWYIIDLNGEAIRVDVRPINPYPTQRPLGPNKIPAYRVDSISHRPYVSQKLVMTYRCHPFWTTLTEINIPIGSEIYDK